METGNPVGWSVVVGNALGIKLGLVVGREEGFAVVLVGMRVGSALVVGDCDVGAEGIGDLDGWSVGLCEGSTVGHLVDSLEGCEVVVGY